MTSSSGAIILFSPNAGLEGVSGGIILETGTSRPGTSGSIHCDEEDRAAGQFTLGAITLPSHLPHTTEKASEKRVKGGKEYHRLAMMPGVVRVPLILSTHPPSVLMFPVFLLFASWHLR